MTDDADRRGLLAELLALVDEEEAELARESRAARQRDLAPPVPERPTPAAPLTAPPTMTAPLESSAPPRPAPALDLRAEERAAPLLPPPLPPRTAPPVPGGVTDAAPPPTPSGGYRPGAGYSQPAPSASPTASYTDQRLAPYTDRGLPPAPEAVAPAPPMPSPDLPPIAPPSAEPYFAQSPSQPAYAPAPSQPRYEPQYQPAPRPRSATDVLVEQLADPSVEARERALREAQSQALGLPPEAIDAALNDPVDSVRKLAIPLAVAEGAERLPQLINLLSARRWPETQKAAFTSISLVIEKDALDETNLSVLLRAVADMPAAINEDERRGLTSIADGLGFERLVSSLVGPDRARVGAARLMFELGTRDCLVALAQFTGDPLPAIAQVASQAAMRIGLEAAPAAPPAPTEDEIALDRTIEREITSSLAKALLDPDPGVRSRARSGLESMDRSALLRWIDEALRSGDETRELAVEVAHELRVAEVAEPLLELALRLPDQDRTRYAEVLASFDLPFDQVVAIYVELDPALRPAAVRLMARLAGPHAMPFLESLLRDTSGVVRLAAMDVLADSSDPAAPGIASDVLTADSSPAVRAAAVKAMRSARLDQRLAALSQAMSDVDADVRATAMELLPASMGSSAAHALLRSLSDTDDRVWQAALFHIARLGSENTPVLWQALTRADERQRSELIEALEVTDDDALAVLALSNIDADDSAHRMLAVELAGRTRNIEAGRAIMRALRDPSPDVRRAAASQVSVFRGAEAIGALSGALTDPDVRVRLEVVYALGLIDDDAVVEVLLQALRDPDVRVRTLATDVLARWRSPGIVHYLVNAMDSRDLEVPVGTLLVSIGPPAVEPLVTALMSGEHRPQAIGNLLTRIIDPTFFFDRLSSMEVTERTRAVVALGAMGGEPAIEGLVRALNDPEPTIRVRALEALGNADARSDAAFDAVRGAFLGDPVIEVVNAAEQASLRLEEARREMQVVHAAAEAERREMAERAELEMVVERLQRAARAETPQRPARQRAAAAPRGAELPAKKAPAKKVTAAKKAAPRAATAKATTDKPAAKKAAAKKSAKPPTAGPAPAAPATPPAPRATRPVPRPEPAPRPVTRPEPFVPRPTTQSIRPPEAATRPSSAPAGDDDARRGRWWRRGS